MTIKDKVKKDSLGNLVIDTTFYDGKPATRTLTSAEMFQYIVEMLEEMKNK